MGSINLMIACVMVAMAGLAPTVQANYHVSRSPTSLGDNFLACPSNYYRCACFQNGDRVGTISQKPPSLTDFFTITKFCGYQQLNHYHNGDGTYSAFVAGGDGRVVATCYGADTRRVTLNCPVFKVPNLIYDYLICYGQPCQPDHQHGSEHLH